MNAPWLPLISTTSPRLRGTSSLRAKNEIFWATPSSVTSKSFWLRSETSFPRASRTDKPTLTNRTSTWIWVCAKHANPARHTASNRFISPRTFGPGGRMQKLGFPAPLLRRFPEAFLRNALVQFATPADVSISIVFARLSSRRLAVAAGLVVIALASTRVWSHRSPPGGVCRVGIRNHAAPGVRLQWIDSPERPEEAIRLGVMQYLSRLLGYGSAGLVLWQMARVRQARRVAVRANSAFDLPATLDSLNRLFTPPPGRADGQHDGR